MRLGLDSRRAAAQVGFMVTRIFPIRPGACLFFACCLMLAASGAAAEPAPNYFFRNWQVENGLPQNKLCAVVQTRDGYLWVGTYSGLARFDGVRFQVFDDQNTPELGNSRVSCLYEAPDGALWIGHEDGGVTRYQDGQFAPVEIRADWASQRIYCITTDDAGEIWVMNESASLARVRDGLVLTTPAGNSRRLMGFTRSPNGTLWVAHDGRLSFMERGQIHPAVFNLPITNNYNYVQGICASRDGGLWINSNGKLRKWQAGAVVQDLGAAPWGVNPLICLKETRRGILVAGTASQGFYLVFPGTNQPPLHFNQINGMQVDWIRSVAEDQEGDLWLGTGGNGLLEMRPSPIQTPAPPDHWRGRAVLTVCPARNGAIWAGTEGAGLYCYQAGGWRKFGYTNGLGNSYVWSVAEDAAGQIWAGNWGSGLFLLAGDRFKGAPGPDRVPPIVPALLAARDGGLWVGTADGLLHYQAGRINRFNTGEGRLLRDVRTMAEDEHGTLWFGTAGHGLGCLAGGRIRCFDRRDGLSSEYIECLHCDDDGALWIGTFGGGLCRWKEGRMAVINRHEGLPNSIIGDIEDDDRGYFWMSSHGGLIRAAKAALNRCADGASPTVACLTYGVNDGLPTIECAEGLQPAGGKSADGRLWFPTSKGLVVVDPNAVRVNLQPPPMALEEVLVDGERVTNRLSPLRIPAGRSHFEFHYTGLSYVAPEKVTFKYRLEGFEQAWVEAGAKRQAIYSFLPPGHYAFHVIAANNDGIWNEPGVSLPFILLPRFWQTWWFQFSGAVLTVLAASGMVWFETRRRMRHRLEKLERQQAVERERARIAKDIHDDLGASLTHITMLSQAPPDPAGVPAAVAANLDRIHDTACELTRSMDEIVWAVNPQHDTLDSLAGYLNRFANVYMSAAGVRCRLDFPLQLPARPVTAEVRHNLFLAFKETLHNVASHAAAAEVCVTLQLEADDLVLFVTDNGRGFDPVQSPAGPSAKPDRFSPGNGLANIRRRLLEIKGRCEVHSAPGRGTTVKFTVPLPKFSPPQTPNAEIVSSLLTTPAAPAPRV